MVLMKTMMMRMMMMITVVMNRMRRSMKMMEIPQKLTS